ncbi:hypothetical protein K3495_g235 [Podosphaera aphanis]|nr:hypothetical protein K3495_g235 [Podosphaera aphanis]
MVFCDNHRCESSGSTSTSRPYFERVDTKLNLSFLSEERETNEANGVVYKKRKAPDSVTRNACLNCKKARTKCDGKQPCQRCAIRLETHTCRYQAHSKNTKEELVKQIKELQEKQHLTEQILQALRKEEKQTGIIQRLQNGEKYYKIVDWLGRPRLSDAEPFFSGNAQNFPQELARENRKGFMSSRNSWTSVTTDKIILDHLFQLYFAWVHPVHTLLNEGRFVQSYNQESTEYCSSVLVNAICALSCHMHPAAEEDVVNFERLGKKFSDAVACILKPDDKSITTIQTFGILFLLESARSQGLRANSYLKLATENLPHVSCRGDGGFMEVWRDTVRGIRNLNVEWAHVTFQVPPIVSSAPYGDCEDDDDLDQVKWYFYQNSSGPCYARPSLLATTNREKAKLIAIIHDVTTMMYRNDGKKISMRQLTHQYDRFVIWWNELPSSMRNFEDKDTENQILPHVLSLLILWCQAQVMLLRPLLDLNGFLVSVVEDFILHCAQWGLYLLDKHYRAKFTCKYQSVLQMFAILHMADVIARFFPGGGGLRKDGSETIMLGIEALSVGPPVASLFQELLRRCAEECAICLPLSPPTQPYRLDILIDAFTRSTYKQPVEQINQNYSPSFCSDIETEGIVFRVFEPMSSTRQLRLMSSPQILMQVRNLLNQH